MMMGKDKSRLWKRAMSADVDIDKGLLALLIQVSDDDLFIPAKAFPLGVIAGRKIFIDDQKIRHLMKSGGNPPIFSGRYK